MNAKSLIGFLWFYFFISIVIISALSFHVSDVKKDLLDTRNKIDALEQRNQSLSYNLTKTRDSLEVATSQDILWLSRILYSETGKPLEMYYIAHIVKNRVETCYNGECSYKGVALDPYEFSAFNRGRDTRYYLMDLKRKNAYNPAKWAASKQIALDVYMSNYDPTNGATHFFAQVGMPNHSFPNWAYHGEEVELPNNINENRLRIYKNVR